MLETERSSVRGHAEFTEAQRREGVCPRLMGSGRSETKIQAHGCRPALSLLHHWAGRNHSSVLPHCRPLKHCGCSYPEVGSSPGEPSFPFRSLPHGKKASRSPPSRHGGRVENGGNRPAQLLPGGVPGPPYSLFRHVLQLQVVHLQSSPQMQIPPRREDRVTNVRTEMERGP